MGSMLRLPAHGKGHPMKRTLSTFFILALLLTSCGSKTPTWQENYDTGIKLLSSSEFDQAIVAFTAAIEIDPKNCEAYVGRGDAYAAKAKIALEAGDTEEALELYQLALDDYETAKELGAENMDEKIEQAEQNKSLISGNSNASDEDADLLKAMLDQFAADDVEGAESLSTTDPYIELSDSIEDTCSFYSEDGITYVAAYPDSFFYYGGMDGDHNRSGHGVWIHEDPEGSYRFEGEWENDLPNGSGTVRTSNSLEETVEMFEYTGQFSDGYYNGEFTEVWYFTDGTEAHWTPITYVDGVAQPDWGAAEKVFGSAFAELYADSDFYPVAAEETLNIIHNSDGLVTTVYGLGLE